MARPFTAEEYDLPDWMPFVPRGSDHHPLPPGIVAVNYNIDLNDHAAVRAELVRINAVPHETNADYTIDAVRQLLGANEPSDIQTLRFCQAERRVLEHRGDLRLHLLAMLTDSPHARARAKVIFMYHLYMIEPQLLVPSLQTKRTALITMGEINNPRAREGFNDLEEQSCFICNMTFDCRRKYFLHLTTKNHQAVFHDAQTMCPTCKAPLNWDIASHLMSASHCEKRYEVLQDELFLHTLD
jgi:hypothetical protein